MKFSQEVADALASEKAVVALESTVIAHGLPYPQNLETARRMELIIRQAGAVPATIALLGGRPTVGLTDKQLTRLAAAENIRKISKRDLAIAAARKLDGATTVAATCLIARRAGIGVFATGGIGGVHRDFPADVSADLPVLARTPLTVVCSGAKSVLDLAATREWLETNGICVLGYRCREMPAFYARSSGLPVDAQVETAAEAAEIAAARDRLGLDGSILLTVPVPERSSLPAEELDELLGKSLRLAGEKKIRGKELTPFLLSQMAALSRGKTLAANIALLENNARVAAEVALCL